MSNKKYKGLTLRIRGFRDDLYAFIDVDTEINHKYYLQNYECFDQIIKDTITRNLSFVINKSGMRCKPDPQNIKEIGFWTRVWVIAYPLMKIPVLILS